jgi:hypothetical protein
MKTQQVYTNHPLLPLMQLLDGIESSKEFQDRRVEILDAIHLAAPILKDRTPECCRLAKGSYFASHGTATVPFRMARFVESRVKETLHLARPKTKSSPTSNPSKRRPSPSTDSIRQSAAPIQAIPYKQLREFLPAISTIPTLGGRAEIEIHNPAGGHLMVINSNGGRYHVTEADWNNACAIRGRNPRNPWATRHYTDYHDFTSYGLIHAAAILREVEEATLAASDALEAA